MHSGRGSLYSVLFFFFSIVFVVNTSRITFIMQKLLLQQLSVMSTYSLQNLNDRMYYHHPWDNNNCDVMLIIVFG